MMSPDLADNIARIQRIRLTEIIEGKTLAVFVERPYDTSPTFVGFTSPAVIHTLQWLWIYKVIAGPDCPRCGQSSSEHRPLGDRFVVCPDGFLDESPEPYPAVDATDDGCSHGD